MKDMEAKWIKTEDKMPKNGLEVIVPVTVRKQLVLIHCYYFDWVFRLKGSGKEIKNNITHWTPAPIFKLTGTEI